MNMIIKTKKILAFACVIAMITTLTACGGQASSSAVPNGGSQLVSSEAEESAAVSSGVVSSGIVSGGAATSEAAAANSTLKAVASKNKGDYQADTIKYRYDKDNMDYTASYPQLSGKIANLVKINTALKSCALQTINSFGTGKKSVKTTVKVTGEITYEGKDFISVGFNEYATLSPKAKSQRVLRTVNINLKTGASVGLADLIVKNDALYKALEKAAKEQKDASSATALTAAAIKSGLDANAIYFTDDGVGFSVQTSGAQKHISTVNLTYQEVKPFMTKNEIWKNFL